MERRTHRGFVQRAGICVARRRREDVDGAGSVGGGGTGHGKRREHVRRRDFWLRERFWLGFRKRVSRRDGGVRGGGFRGQ